MWAHALPPEPPEPSVPCGRCGHAKVLVKYNASKAGVDMHTVHLCIACDGPSPNVLRAAP